MCDQQTLRPACAYVQYDQSLFKLLDYSMSVKLLTEHHLEFLNLKRGCTGLSESTLAKMPHCWKSHFTAHNITRLAGVGVKYVAVHLKVLDLSYNKTFYLTFSLHFLYQ